jgi:hypothetical protein
MINCTLQSDLASVRQRARCGSATRTGRRVVRRATSGGSNSFNPRSASRRPATRAATAALPCRRARQLKLAPGRVATVTHSLPNLAVTGRTVGTGSARLLIRRRQRSLGLRVCPYGRIFTENQQDPESSRGWQLTRFRSLIEARCRQIVGVTKRGLGLRGRDDIPPDSKGPGGGSTRSKRTFKPPRCRDGSPATSTDGALAPAPGAIIQGVNTSWSTATGDWGKYRTLTPPVDRGMSTEMQELPIPPELTELAARIVSTICSSTRSGNSSVRPESRSFRFFSGLLRLSPIASIRAWPVSYPQ